MRTAKNVGSAAWGFRALPLEQQLELAAKHGMVYHELGIANADTDVPMDASEEVLRKIKRLYAEHGLSLACAATGNDFTGDDAPAQLDKVLRVLDLCAVLGVKRLRVFAGFTPLTDMTQEKWKTVLTCMEQAARAAQNKGVTLCVETHGAVEPMLDGVRHIRSATTQVGDLLRIVEHAGVQIVFDPANLAAVGEEDLAGFLAAFRDRIGYIHLKDFRRGDGGQLYPCALGEGFTPWESIASAMEDSDLPILFEYENCEDLEKGLLKCMNCWKGESAL